MEGSDEPRTRGRPREISEAEKKPPSQTKSVRLHCVECNGGTTHGPKECDFQDCPLFLGRLGKRPKGFQPIKAIRAYCLWCTVGQFVEIRECPSTECFLWDFRFGRGRGRQKGGLVDKTLSTMENFDYRVNIGCHAESDDSIEVGEVAANG
jgi:hypothetical protein